MSRISWILVLPLYLLSFLSEAYASGSFIEPFSESIGRHFKEIKYVISPLRNLSDRLALWQCQNQVESTQVMENSCNEPYDAYFNSHAPTQEELDACFEDLDPIQEEQESCMAQWPPCDFSVTEPAEFSPSCTALIGKDYSCENPRGSTEVRCCLEECQLDQQQAQESLHECQGRQTPEVYWQNVIDHCQEEISNSRVKVANCRRELQTGQMGCCQDENVDGLGFVIRAHSCECNAERNAALCPL